MGVNGSVTAIDWKDEKTMWETTVPDGSETLVTIGDKVYVSSHQIVALLQDTGEIAWKSSQFPMLRNPILHDGHLSARDTENGLYMFRNENGEQLGKLLVKPFPPNPSMAGDLLLVPFGDERVFAYTP